MAYYKNNLDPLTGTGHRLNLTQMETVLEQPVTNTNPVETVQPLTKPRLNRGRIQQRDQAATLQRLAYDAALALKESCTNAETGKLVMDCKTAVAVQKLIGAWDTARDGLRVLRGKGLPASVKPVKGGSGSQVKPLGEA